MPDFLKRFGDLEGKELNEAIAALQGDLEEYLARMINEKHAPLMIPRTTIDCAHSQFDFAAGDRAAVEASMYLENSGDTTSTTYATIVSYDGRGILTKCLLGSFDSAGTSAISSGLRITIDGNVVFDDTTFTSRHSAMKVAVGNFHAISTTAVAVSDAYPGLPFNSNCTIEALVDSGTVTVGWKIAKKL